MKPVLSSFLHKLSPRHWVLVGLLLLVVLVQHIPAWGACYARTLYPLIARPLSFVSGLVPLAVGDLFIASSLLWMVAWPFYARLCLKRSWRQTAGRMAEYLLWLYAWFYLAWGLNYSQPNFYQRTGIAYTPFEAEQFERCASDYIDSLNAAYLPVDQVDKELVRRESIAGYRQLAGNMGVHTPFRDGLRVKTMLFSPFISMVGVTGSMGPFFCEFTVNADVLPADYPATYAHEMSHLLGITSEAEANLYAYLVCTRSTVPEVKYSGYYSILPHVLQNAQRLLPDSTYQQLPRRIRPEIVAQLQSDHAYWSAKYSQLIGSIQNQLYDWYLKGNRIESGRKNYSEVIGLLMSVRAGRQR